MRSFERCCLVPENVECQPNDRCTKAPLVEAGPLTVGAFTLGMRAGPLAQRRHLNLRHPLLAGLRALEGCDTAAWDEVFFAFKIKGGCLPCSTPPGDLQRYMSLWGFSCVAGRLILALTKFMALPEERPGEPPQDAHECRAEALQLLASVEDELRGRAQGVAARQTSFEEVFFDLFGLTTTQIRYLLHHTSLRNDYEPIFQYSQSTVTEGVPAWGTFGPGAQPLPLAFDLGASGGMDALFYLLHGFRVVAVEANPIMALDVRTALRRYGSRLLVLSAAIVSEDELAAKTDPSELGLAHVPFHIHKWRPDFSALDGERVPTKWRAGTVPVKAVSCAGLVAIYGRPLSVKIDAEGADRACLTSLHSAGAAPPYVSTELPNVFLEGSGPALALLQLLKSMGYTGYKLCRQSLYNARTVVAVDQETNLSTLLVSRQGIGLGASGPFGGAAVDWVAGLRWRQSAEISAELGQGGPVWVAATMQEWFDLHARKW